MKYWHYKVNMISKDVEFFQQHNQPKEIHWYEEGKGRSILADDVGFAIENRRMNPKKLQR